MNYDDFRASTTWANRRQRYWAEHPGQRACSACGSTSRVHLHHLHYDPTQQGTEPDSDLLPLCPTHHAETHDLFDANTDTLTLREATAIVVERHGGPPLPKGDPKPPPRNTDQWQQHVTVACPTCQASAGEPCVKVNSHGRRQNIRGVHRARKTAAKRAARQSP